MNNSEAASKINIVVVLLLCAVLALGCGGARQNDSVRLAVLLSGDIRLDALAGLEDGLAGQGYVQGQDLILDVYNGGGDRSRLPDLAQEIAASEPDLAIAAGGVEADALKLATEGTGLPVVFLAVSSAVDRGLAASMRSSGNNLTGIETNDTNLTSKRLEWIARMLPEARHVLILNVPSITPSAKAAQVAQEAAPELGLTLRVVNVETEAEIRQAAASISADQTDAILLLPSAPIWQAMRQVLYPVSVAEGIPIFGVNHQDLERGAMACYAGSRYDAGKQAARLVDRVLNGTPPSDIPIETPQELEFVINRLLVERLGIDIPGQVWDLADSVVEIDLE